MILDVIVEDKKKRLVEHKNTISEEDMKQQEETIIPFWEKDRV